jgi:hypothetical protein
MAELMIPDGAATRYDFIRGMDEWEGWKVLAAKGATVLAEEVAGEGFNPEPVLDVLAEMGWITARWAPYHIRSWRGDNVPIARMDFVRLPDGRWQVRRWKAGWLASTDPSYEEIKPSDWDARVAWSWLNEHGAQDHGDMDGWRIQRAGWFVRAWKGPLLPVRNAGQIKRRRDELHRYRVALAMAARGEPVQPERPAWMPESLGLDLDEIEALDLAYML